LLLNHHREVLEDVAGVRRSSASQPPVLLSGGAWPESDGSTAGRAAGGRGERVEAGAAAVCERVDCLQGLVDGKRCWAGPYR
jgi:hypothetical protein